MSTGYINQGQYIKTSSNSISDTIETNRQVTINVPDYTTPVEVTPSQEFKAMEKVTVTLTNTTEANKQVTINVTDYTNPVEVTPSQEFNTMEKVTVALGLPTRMYAWKNTGGNISYTKFPSTDKSDGHCYQTPAIKNAALLEKNAGTNGDQIYVIGWPDDLYSRYPDNDILWR